MNFQSSGRGCRGHGEDVIELIVDRHALIMPA